MQTKILSEPDRKDLTAGALHDTLQNLNADIRGDMVKPLNRESSRMLNKMSTHKSMQMAAKTVKPASAMPARRQIQSQVQQQLTKRAGSNRQTRQMVKNSTTMTGPFVDDQTNAQTAGKTLLSSGSVPSNLNFPYTKQMKDLI